MYTIAIRYSSNSFLASNNPTAALVGASTETRPVDIMPAIPPKPPNRRVVFAAALSGFFTFIMR